MSPIEIAIEYAWDMIGLPYKWGGSNPMVGFDCSGLCVDIAQAIGLIPRHTDFSSQGLWLELGKTGIISKREAGSFSFYGKSLNDISHVAFHISRIYIIEAGGGDHTTITRERAIEQNAFVRVSPYFYRKDYLASVYPKYPLESA